MKLPLPDDLGLWRDTLVAIGQTFSLPQKLQAEHRSSFTPDGRFIGSIGEVVASAPFEIELMPASHRGHDANRCGSLVEVKLTGGDHGVAIRHQPDYLPVLQLSPGLGIDVVYNGLGEPPWQAAQRRKGLPASFNDQFSVRLSKLSEFTLAVLAEERVPERQGSEQLRALLPDGLRQTQ